MARPYNEDWIRQKAYLTKSLLQDYHSVPHPSTIWEESSDSPGLPPSTQAYRPCSPLPPLVIEIVHRSRNRHDESEEYYKVLEKKILRIYQKLFVKGRELSDADVLTNITDSSNGKDVANATLEFCNIASLDNEERDDTAGVCDNNVLDDTHDDSQGDMSDVDMEVNDLYDINEDRNSETTIILPPVHNLNEMDTCPNASDDIQSDANGYSADIESYETVEVSSDEADENNNSMTEKENENRICKMPCEGNVPDAGEILEDTHEYTTEEESGVDYRQITTQAQIHVDGTPTIIAQSVVYEGSVKSPILQPPMIVKGIDVEHGLIHESLSNVQDQDREEAIGTPGREEESTLLDKNIGPENEEMFLYESENNTMEGIEIMRSPLPKFSSDSIPRTAQHDSEVSSEREIIHEASSITEPDATLDSNLNLTSPSSYIFTLANETNRKKRKMGIMKSGVFHASRLKDQFIVNITNGSTENTGFDIDRGHIWDTIDTDKNVNSNTEAIIRVVTSNETENLDYIDMDRHRDATIQNDNVHVNEGMKKSSSRELAEILDEGTYAEPHEYRGEFTENLQRNRKRRMVDVGVEAVAARVNWNDINDKLFLDAPKIFRLCSCMNHVCF